MLHSGSVMSIYGQQTQSVYCSLVKIWYSIVVVDRSSLISRLGRYRTPKTFTNDQGFGGGHGPPWPPPGSATDLKSIGLRRYLKLEAMLLQGKIDDSDVDIVHSYPELDYHCLSTQLALFHSQMKYSSLQTAVNVMREVHPDVRKLFNQVERLLRLLLVCPASSCEAERSLSALRRLKTWLRNSMSQSRLNSVAICHVHQQLLDDIDLTSLCADFASRSEIRRSTFGQIFCTKLWTIKLHMSSSKLT